MGFFSCQAPAHSAFVFYGGSPPPSAACCSTALLLLPQSAVKEDGQGAGWLGLGRNRQKGSLSPPSIVRPRLGPSRQ